MTKKRILLVVIVLLIGLILRIHNYTLYPQRGASSDEYTYSFLGISLLTKGYPESWSNLNKYPEVVDLTIDGIYFPMVHPYFDHPPLNGILVGGWALLNGENTYQKVNLLTIRLIPIGLSILSSLLLFFLTNKLFNYKTALWSLLIYSTATSFVMNQRVVFAENLLTPLILGSLCIIAYSKKLSNKKIIILALLSGLAFWAKELGICVFFSTLYLLVENIKSNGMKKIFYFIAISSAFFFGYVIYGHFYNGSIFWTIISTQSNRIIGPDTIQLLTTTPIIVNKPYFDGWYFFGFLSFFTAFTDYKKYKLLLVPSFIYFMLMIFSINKTGEMGWYMIPLFPFMAIFSASFLYNSIEKNNWYIFLLLSFVGFYELKNIYELYFGLTTTQFRLFLLFMFAPLISLKLIGKNHTFRKLSTLWFYALIIGTAIITFNYTHPT